MTPLAARIHIVGGDAAQHRDRQSVPQSMREGHRSGSVVCCPAGRCWCLRAAAEGCEYKRVCLGLLNARVATDSLLVSELGSGQKAKKNLVCLLYCGAAPPCAAMVYRHGYMRFL